ncbi:hypothetical protein VmeM32_00230 [Vibrio phage vB_VmeM-32]|nr:hypothetical protein VmeM32_00230 [Vibrio phage vB_VmeM-32]
MSTTANKLNYLYDTTKIVKDAAQASLYVQGRPLLPNNATFRDYANVLHPLERIIYNHFSDGTLGAFYIPRPTMFGKQVLFQDSAGTIPVVNDGDPVGRIEDLSGNGFHATQSDDARRPLYKTDGILHWLESDGFQVDGVGKRLGHELNLRGDVTMIVSAERLGNNTGTSDKVQGIYTATAPNNRIVTFIIGNTGSAFNNGWGSYGSSWTSTNIDILNNRSILSSVGRELPSPMQNLYTNSEFSLSLNNNYPGDQQSRRSIFAEQDDSAARFFNGKIFFIFSANKLLSDTERNYIEQQFSVLSGIS